MILQSLNSLYERLNDDPDSGIASFGFSPQKITFSIVIDKEGKFIQLADQRREDGKRLIPRIVKVLGGAKPSGSGINPCLLWDNAAYLLGYKPDDSKPERTLECFEVSRNYHCSLEKEIDHPAYSAVCRFLESWELSKAEEIPELVEATTGFLVFQIAGEECFVHEHPEIRAWWEKQLLESEENSKDEVQGTCLLSGEDAVLARLHEPKIKGVRGAQSAGAALVSFNDSAYESYGKSQAYNSPVSNHAAFQYCTALNFLLSRERNRSFTVGDATVVFWTEKPSEMEHLFTAFLDPQSTAEDDSLREKLKHLFTQISQGQCPEELGDEETPFYILGLSPNAARISVRFWYVSTLGEMVEHLHMHLNDLEIEGITSADQTLSINDIAGETVTLKNGWPDRDRISSKLSGSISKAVLSGQPYPKELLDNILSRIKAEGFVNVDEHKGWRKARHRRAAIIKSYIVRSNRIRKTKDKEIFVDISLNKIHPSGAYQCGRLMGVLAMIQGLALNKIGSSVVRKYLAATSSSPSLHLGRLQVNAEIGHLHKLPENIAQFLRDELKEINVQLGDSLPKQLNGVEQGMFMLGYYQETTFLEKTLPAKGDLPDGKFRRTDAGLWVRSNGEKQLANCLTQLGITFFYEPRAILAQGPDRYPDFFIPGVEESSNKFIEFLGMKNNAEYDKKWESKLLAYRASGITETGGDRGQLLVMDCRKEDWDETRMLTQLKEWFQN